MNILFYFLFHSRPKKINLRFFGLYVNTPLVCIEETHPLRIQIYSYSGDGIGTRKILFDREVFGCLGIYSRMFLPRIFKKASTILLFGLLKPASRPPGGVFFSFRMLGSRNRPSFFSLFFGGLGHPKDMSPKQSVCYCYYIWVI